MLSLLDPVEFEDAFIFRDDVDPRKFYPLPDQPIIPVDDEGNPEFLFIKYIKDISDLPDTDKDLGGGILQFRSVLTMKPERRDKILAHLRQQLQQEKAAGRKPFGHPIDSTDPLLADPLWTSGKVSLATFKVSDTGLVRYASDGAPVDLAGGLGASVSLQLDDTGAEIFWSAFQGYKDKQIPIMLTYQLTYKARVSASMTIHADRQLIQQNIVNQARPYQLMNSPFIRYVPIPTTKPFTMSQLPAMQKLYRVPVAAMVPRQQIQDTIHQGILKNEIKVSITSDEDSSAQGASDVRDAMFKLATQMLSDRVVPALFGENSAQPGANSADDKNANLNLVQIQESAAGGNISFDLTFDHQATVDRQVNPNGPIQLLIDDDRVLTNCFKQLRLTDGFFQAMNVSASTAGVNFKADGVETVHVFFKYSQKDEADPAKPMVVRTKDDLLKSEQDAIHWRFDMARQANGSPKKTYSYMTEVFYREGPPSQSDWAETETQKLVITPHAMGALRVELQLTAPETEVNSAKVLLKYQAQSGSVYKTALELTPKDPKKTWFQYTGELSNDSDINPPEYTYQVIYRVGGGEITMPPTKSNSKTLEISRPFNKTLKFTLLPQGSFDGVRDISGDFRYQDDLHQYNFLQSFQLTSLTSSVAISVPVLDGGPEKARWQARIDRTDGSSVDLGYGDAVPGNVFIGRNSMKVDFNTDLVDFDKQIQLAVVVMKYDDPTNNISEHKTFTFSKSSRGQQSWIVNRASGGPSKYDVNVRFIAYDRSKNKEIQFHQIDDDIFLLDPAAQPQN